MSSVFISPVFFSLSVQQTLKVMPGQLFSYLAEIELKVISPDD